MKATTRRSISLLGAIALLIAAMAGGWFYAATAFGQTADLKTELAEMLGCKERCAAAFEEATNPLEPDFQADKALAAVRIAGEIALLEKDDAALDAAKFLEGVYQQIAQMPSGGDVIGSRQTVVIAYASKNKIAQKFITPEESAIMQARLQADKRAAALLAAKGVAANTPEAVDSYLQVVQELKKKATGAVRRSLDLYENQLNFIRQFSSDDKRAEYQALSAAFNSGNLGQIRDAFIAVEAVARESGYEEVVNTDFVKFVQHFYHLAMRMADGAIVPQETDADLQQIGETFTAMQQSYQQFANAIMHAGEQKELSTPGDVNVALLPEPLPPKEKIQIVPQSYDLFGANLFTSFLSFFSRPHHPRGTFWGILNKQ